MVVFLPDDRCWWSTSRRRSTLICRRPKRRATRSAALALRRHALAVQERVRQLGQKAYWSQFEHSPDFVILFIPGDQFLAAAMTELPTLLEDAIRQHVILATPTSFVALLKAVAYGWRQNALTENALQIQQLGEEIYKRLATFTVILPRSARRSARAWRPITQRSARWSARCCRARENSPSSACGPCVRSKT